MYLMTIKVNVTFDVSIEDEIYPTVMKLMIEHSASTLIINGISGKFPVICLQEESFSPWQCSLFRTRATDLRLVIILEKGKLF